MNKNNPELRFNEFTKNWEKSKLEDLTELITKGTTPIDKLWKGPVNYIKTESINPYNGNINMKSNTSLEEHEGHLKRSQLKIGDILFSIVGTLGRVGLVEEKDIPANTNQQIAIIRLNAAVDNYVLNVLKTSKVTSFINSDATIGAQPSLSLWQIKKLTLLYPEIKEQTKIGELFKQLDDIITLQQQLLDDHKQLKKAMLQNMFPQKGKITPKIRSNNFTGEWKEYKSKDIFCSITDKNHPNLPVLSASQKEGMIYRSDIAINIQYNKDSTSTYKRVVPGQFVIHLRSFQGGFAYSNIEGITSPAYTVIDFKSKDKQHSIFWKQILTSNIFIKQLETITYGIRDGRSISFTDFSTLKFRVPSYDEQEKISNFFNQLDATIALNEQKLENYQDLKKAMLQKMFV